MVEQHHAHRADHRAVRVAQRQPADQKGAGLVAQQIDQDRLAGLDHLRHQRVRHDLFDAPPDEVGLLVLQRRQELLVALADPDDAVRAVHHQHAHRGAREGLEHALRGELEHAVGIGRQGGGWASGGTVARPMARDQPRRPECADDDRHLQRGHDGVARVVLAHPGKLNAIDIAMWRELRTLFDMLQALPPAEAPRAIVVSGAGGQFASGGDIVEFASFRFIEAELHDFHEHIVAPALHAMLNCDIPLLAQIDGACIGGGLEIAACCDIRICGEGSRFGAPIAKLGFPMAPGELELLLPLAGAAAMRELLLEARLLDAARALQLGLVHAVVADAEVERTRCNARATWPRCRRKPRASTSARCGRSRGGPSAGKPRPSLRGQRRAPGRRDRPSSRNDRHGSEP